MDSIVAPKGIVVSSRSVIPPTIKPFILLKAPAFSSAKIMRSMWYKCSAKSSIKSIESVKSKASFVPNKLYMMLKFPPINLPEQLPN